ncbi:DAK2 domain-containing protein [Isoptericola cucumis]|uniref:DhaL domain-containing protein n=2 Tax=Isoptericola cucumis TaxID=1776856 RepID=A0ABQ2B655_9MICO|nr:DAK2 domain-containing protein [Isoptericola cucumis]GGI06205.1 hypothetical protein GCM10007368_10000 [Isoptericola cucumis]
MAHDVPPGELLEAEVVRAWVPLAVDALGGARQALDSANVFPVPDGDTGTNMYLTLREGAHAVRGEHEGADGARLLRLLARGALLGARGNSGVILSEWLRGLAAAATRRETLAAGLGTAARTAHRAVASPAPGTILTAAQAAADAAGSVAAPPGAVRPGPRGGDRQKVLDAARRGARQAALDSAGSLAALRDAGVLDSGAGGLVLVLQTLGVAHREVTSRRARPPLAGAMSEGPGTMAAVTLDIDLRGPGARGALVAGAAEHAAHRAGDPAGPAADELELMFVLHRPATAADYSPGEVADALRRDLATVGGSVVVVGGSGTGDEDGAAGGDPDSLWQAHVHTADLGAALDVPRRWAARARVSHVHVRHLATHDVAGCSWGAVVATTSPGLAAELARGGATVLVGLDRPVTAEDLAAAAVGDAHGRVMVLPGEVARREVEAAVDAYRAADPDPAAAEPSIVVLDAPTDAHLVVALGVLAESAGAGADDVLEGVRAVLGALRVARHPADRASAALGSLLGPGRGAGVVTVLADDGVDAAVTHALVGAGEAAGSDVLVLPTGRPGDGVVLAVEHEAGTTEGGPEVEG